MFLVVDVLGGCFRDIPLKDSVVELAQIQGICHLHNCFVGHLLGCLGGQQRQGLLRLLEGNGLVGRQRNGSERCQPEAAAKVEKCGASGVRLRNQNCVMCFNNTQLRSIYVRVWLT